MLTKKVPKVDLSVRARDGCREPINPEVVAQSFPYTKFGTTLPNHDSAGGAITMSNPIDRRSFLGATAAAGAALAAQKVSAQGNANNRLLVGVMGTGGRGSGLAVAFARLANVQVAYVCDVDESRVGRTAQEVNRATNQSPRPVGDFRRILDDRSVDVLVCAAPNHWHAPATILACAAGKHVYVEKPCSHNPHEGEVLVQAARRHNRKVQMGNQRRSWPKVIEAIEQVREGAIGRAYFAQSWYLSTRPTIGRGQANAVPQGLNYDLWQGPATRRPFRSNYLHYNWHWFWHWGNGELGNNGIHMIDLCRWGLGVDFPVRVTSSGGRYRFEDDQETPDTHMVHFEFAGRKSICWEGLSCNHLPQGKSADVIFVGERGSLMINGTGYTVHDVSGRETRRETGTGTDAMHFNNFLDSIRGNGRLNSEIEEGHRSTLLCHLGNIAHRTGRALRCDSNNGHILDDREAMNLWRREYEPGWEPRV
jgi:predicted dehydrogenase